MASFGDEVFNVRTSERGLSAIASDGSDVRVGLQAFLDAASAYANRKGASVYLPPGQYGIVARTDRSTDFTSAVIPPGPDIYVPKNVLLWFAPGATLVLERNAVVAIGGDIRGEPARIFTISDVPGHDMTRDDSPRRGRVVFITTKVLELCPEWWGAIARWDVDLSPAVYALNTQALEDCFRAAHTDRSFPGGINFPPIPVVLRGQYYLQHELVIQPMTGPLRHFSGAPTASGIVIRGQQGTGTSNVGVPTFEARPTPSPGATYRSFELFGENDVSGRALLRIRGVHGSVIEGVGFNGAGLSSACVQLTGDNARSTVFRNCSFSKARHVLVQVGDYVIEDPDPTHYVFADDRYLPLLDSRVTNYYDLSFLLFDNCVFDSGFPSDALATYEAQARALVGLVFNANNTLPMTLDRCSFWNMMRACVEAYGGTMIIRGGSAQNQLPALPYQVVSPTTRRRDRPLGGVDVFIGDPVLTRTTDAVSPTGVTVEHFESQSNQFLDTFRHVSGSADRVGFFPTTLSSVTAGATALRRVSASVIWAGPGLLRGSATPADDAARTGTLTLLSCKFRGPRAAWDLPTPAGEAPAGTVVVDKMAYLVSNVGSRAWEPMASVVYQFAHMDPVPGFIPVPVEGALANFPWYRAV